MAPVALAIAQRIPGSPRSPAALDAEIGRIAPRERGG